MDSQIMDMIDREVALLPKSGNQSHTDSEGLYAFWKYRLSSQFPGNDEYQYIAKALARKYDL